MSSSKAKISVLHNFPPNSFYYLRIFDNIFRVSITSSTADAVPLPLKGKARMRKKCLPREGKVATQLPDEVTRRSQRAAGAHNCAERIITVNSPQAIITAARRAATRPQ